MTFDELIGKSSKDLRALLEQGHDIDPEAIAGFEYRGVSLGLPRVVERLTWKMFQKVFFSDESGVRGWNVRVRQRGVHAPSQPKEKDGQPVTFGHFRVRELGEFTPPFPLRGGLMLDYGLPGRAYDPMRRLRDPIVSLAQGDATMLLGWSYLQIGSRAVGTPSFFALQRERPITGPVPPVS